MTITECKARRARRLTVLLGAALLAGPASGQVDAVYHLMRRITPGFTRAQLNAARGMGFQAYLDRQLLNYTTLNDAEATVTANWPIVNMTPAQVAQTYGSTQSAAAKHDLQYAHLWRMFHSDQAFYERMSRFWTNHFNVDFNKRAGSALMPWFEKRVTRLHAFGQFRDLVHASSGTNQMLVPVQGAMALLHYLDNNTNTCFPMPNENYAREVLELHVLGNNDPFTGGGTQYYTEQNVRDLAKMLTGCSFTVMGGAGNPDFLMFEFFPADHCNPPAPYSFLGATIPVDTAFPSEMQLALNTAIDVVDPPPPAGTGLGHVCAEFIAKKLVRAYLTDAPLENLTGTQVLALRRAIDDAVAAFGTDGNVTAMLQAILTQQNIVDVLNAPSPMYKYMAPWQFMSSAVRATAAQISTTNGIQELAQILEGDLSQPPYGFGPPIGYPEEIAVWVQNQPGRWEFAYRLLEENGSGGYGTIPGVTVDVPRHYIPLGGFDRAACAQQANEIIAGGNLSATEVQIIQAFANQSSAPDSEVVWKVLVLALLAPHFNLY